MTIYWLHCWFIVWNTIHTNCNQKQQVHRFLERKVSISTLSGLRCALRGVTIFPAALNNCSELALVVQMQRYLWASRNRIGSLRQFCFHHNSGSSSKSSLEEALYNSISSWNFCSGDIIASYYITLHSSSGDIIASYYILLLYHPI